VRRATGRARVDVWQIAVAAREKRARFNRSVTMTRPLQGQVALVNGAARGIGRAVALKLASEGADVAINYYNSHVEAEALCVEMRALGRRACAIQGSVGVPDSVDEMFATFREHFDRIDIVISNAASGVLKPALEMGLKHWRWCLETNALAVNLIAQRAVPMMRNGGRIVALSSLGSQRAMPGYGFIGASKAALEALVRALAQELGPRGIRVNTVSAGVVDTDALAYFPNREELLRNFAQRTPAGPVLRPEDVANAVYLLCLPEAAMINGHTLVVDGGFSISG
jgi:enoyl-[acyl-carrier protein] reductase III